MEDMEKNEFSWTTLFFVTGACFCIFSVILRLLDATHVTIFSRIGIAMISLGILAYLNKSLGGKSLRRNSSLPSE
jgi:hypothetical protein